MDMRSLTDMDSEGVMAVTDEVLTPTGVRTAVLALLLEGCFGENLLARGWPVLRAMTFHAPEPATSVERVRAVGELVRIGSRSALARGRVEDADEPGRLLGVGTIGFTMIALDDGYIPPDMQESLDASSEPADRSGSDLLETMGMSVPADEPVCRLDGTVHPAVMGPEGRLHGGAHQLMHEAAAVAAARIESGSSHVAPTDFSIHFAAPAMEGPIIATAQTVSHIGDDILCLVELVDAASDSRAKSMSTFRMKVNR